MSITASVFWNDAPLKGALKGAFRVSVIQAAAVAAGNVRGSSGVRSKTKAIITGDGVAIVKSTDFKAHWWEEGIDQHVIGPRNLGRGRGTGLRSRRRKSSTGKGVALKFPDGGFSRAPIQHPGMAERPFLRPMLPIWPVLYRRAASGALAGSFGRALL